MYAPMHWLINWGISQCINEYVLISACIHQLIYAPPYLFALQYQYTAYNNVWHILPTILPSQKQPPTQRSNQPWNRSKNRRTKLSTAGEPPSYPIVVYPTKDDCTEKTRKYCSKSYYLENTSTQKQSTLT